MRIDLVSPPFRGHLRPILGIALELAPAHRVRVLSTPSTMDEIRACGLEASALLDADTERRLETISNPAHAVGSRPWRLIGQFRRTLDVLVAARDALEILYADPAERPHLLVADFTLPIAGPVAARHGIRWWTSLPSPCVLETRAGPPAYCGGLAPREGLAGRLRDGALRRGVRGFKRAVGHLERDRLARLGLSSIYRADGTEAAYSPERVLALGLEDLEFGRGWAPAVDFVGPRLVTPPRPDSAPPPFRAGRRHVLVTCGTHLVHARDAFAAAAAALARARPDLEVHLSEGRVPGANAGGAADAGGDGGAGTDPDNLVRLAWVDYARHVRRYAAVVHHGGAGIAWRCLADAVPAVIVPIDYDQPDNAARLAHAGLALRWAPRRALAPAIARVLDDRDLADRLRRISVRLGRVVPIRTA